MSDIKDRKLGAVLGGLVGDAAAQPLEWMYNADDLQQLIGDRDDVEFHEPAGNPFYRLQTGRNSCYGDQSYVLLKSIVQQKGYDSEAWAENILKFFGPGTEYDITDRSNRPISGPWKHGCLGEFEKTRLQGKDISALGTDQSFDCVVKMIPLVALLAGKPDLLDKVREGVRVTQTHELAVASSLAAARILEQCILKGSFDGVLEQVIKDLKEPGRQQSTDTDTLVAGQLQKVLDVRSKPHGEVARQVFKITCNVPDNFQLALHSLLWGGGLVDTVRRTIRVGGDSCSRAQFIGACAAALAGVDSIPQTWRDMTMRYPEALDLAKQLVEL